MTGRAADGSTGPEPRRPGGAELTPQERELLADPDGLRGGYTPDDRVAEPTRAPSGPAAVAGAAPQDAAEGDGTEADQTPT